MAKPTVDPQRWTPPRSAGLTGPFARNERLAGLRRVDVGTGPEDVAVDSKGRVITGLADGRILAVAEEGQRVEALADTGGRPLGIEVLPDDTLVVCDAERGLLAVDPVSGGVTTLLAEWGGRRLRFTNNCAVGADGTIYVSESSDRFGIDHFKGDIIEHGGRGRLLRRDPGGSVDLLAEGLDFANGVALAHDESFVLVAETAGYRIRRLWLEGPRSGQSEVVLENLPGLPDNMSTGSGGIFWIAIPSERNALLDRLLPLPGILRKAVWALPEKLQPDASRIAFVVGIDGSGTVVHNLQSHSGAYHYVTGVREHSGRLYLGSLVESGIAMIDLDGAVG